MKRRENIRGAGMLILATLVGLMFALVPTMAAALDPCENLELVDSDQDGFWDCQELAPVTVCENVFVLDPKRKDLFVILVRASDLDSSVKTNIPYDGESDYYDPLHLARDLGVNIHVIPYDSALQCGILDTRVVNDSPFQKALKITEDLRTSVTEIGSSSPGKPDGRDEATVYTERIWEVLVKACPGIINDSQMCVDKEGTYGLNLFPLYIQNTIAHEIGHMVRALVYPYTTKYEYHYKENSYTIMERSIVATTDKKTKVVTIPISKAFTTTDRDNVQLIR